MSMFDLWLLTTVIPGLDASVGLCMLLLGLVGGVLLMFCAFATFDNDDAAPQLQKLSKIAVATWLCLLVLKTLLPNEDQLKWIVGGYFATNIEGVEQLPPNVIRAANKFLEDFSAVVEE